VAYVDGRIKCCLDDLTACAVEAVGSVDDLSSRETAFVFHREGEDADDLVQALSDAYEDIGFAPIEGCQENCDLMMGIV